MATLKITNLTKSFGHLMAVKGISLQMEAGERRAIIGPNGAGKTTFFNLLSGEIAPTSGRVEFDGQEITHLPTFRRAQLGIGRTFQRNSLMPKLTVLENVCLAVQARQQATLWRTFLTPISAKSELMANAESIVRELDLERSKGVRAGHLAYGEQRRLEIALAMATQPRLLLLDEPTAGMSMPEALELVSWLQRLPRTVTMLIVEHNMDVVFGLADQIMVLYYGEMLADGPAAEVRRNPSVMSVYLGDEEIL